MTVVAQRSLAGGELTPSLHQRVDVAKYQSAVAKLRNWQIMRQGGVRTRSGFYHAWDVKDSSKSTRVIPFIYGTGLGQNFALEFGDQYIRPVDGPRREAQKDIESIATADPAVFTITGHGYSNGDDLLIDAATESSMPSDFRAIWSGSRAFRVANKTANTFQLEYLDGPDAGDLVDSSAMDLTGYGSGDLFVSRVYTISSPYLEAHLFDLQYVQSGSTITITHPSYAPRELTYDGATLTLSTITFAPGVSAPTNLAVAGSTTGQTARSYKVTTINQDTLEESLPTSAQAAVSTDKYLEWTAVSGAQEYNVYGYGPAGYGLMAIVEPNTSGTGGKVQWQIDSSISPDVSEKYPISRTPFGSTSNYPSAVAYIQQRQAFAATNNEPEKVWLTKTGFYKNLSVRSPLQEDDAVTFTMAGGTRNRVRHLLDLGRLVILTEAAEKICDGGGDGVLTPFAINPRTATYFGASKVKPAVIGSEALYVQARQSTVRNIGWAPEAGGFSSRDLSIFSAHLFDDYAIVEMAYQQVPHSTLWCVRDDGVLLGLTYLREQQIEGWHRHDSDGYFESICVIPQGSDDLLYAVVRRTINGQTVRSIEVMQNLEDTRQCGLDGCTGLAAPGFGALVGGFENPALASITLSGGTNWDENETFTATTTVTGGGGFLPYSDDASYVGLVIVHPDHGMVRLAIEGWTSANVFTVRPDRTVPAAFQGVSTADVADTAIYRSLKRIKGLWHLEGEDVAVVGGERAFMANDQTGAIEDVEKAVEIANPNDPNSPTYTVANGLIDLDDYVVNPRVGLPYLCDIETLDIDSVKTSIVNKQKLVTEVTLKVEKTRGLLIGGKEPTGDDPTEGLYEPKLRKLEGYDEAIDALTGDVTVQIDQAWSSGGRVFIRQPYALEATILMIAPNVTVSGGR